MSIFGAVCCGHYTMDEHNLGGGSNGGGGKRVVVIGGGVAGSLIARSLQFHSDLTLIDSKEYFEIPWASLRAMVEPSFAERSLIKHRDYITNGRVITSSAISFTDNQVLTEEGRLVVYDYLVIATGHDDPAPNTRAERLRQYQAENQKIESARTILIVGGGPSGVELAGELAVDFPDKRVILVHQGQRLLEYIGPKASNKAMEWLKSKRVEVKLGQSVIFTSNSDQDGLKKYQTSGGDTIQADCCFLCTGRPVGSEWLQETSLSSSLDGHGRLIVDENLRVKGRSNIFAIGDITNIQEIKQGYAAQKHALVVAENLKLLLKGGVTGKKMATYTPSAKIKVIVSLGRKEAVAQLPYTTITGLVAGMMKSKDLYVGKTRKQIGLEPHGLH